MFPINLGEIQQDIAFIWPEEAISVKVAGFTMHEKSTFKNYISTCTHIESLHVCMSSLYVQTNTSAYSTNILFCSNQKFKELINILYADYLMKSGYTYPPTTKIDNSDRSSFDVSIRVEQINFQFDGEETVFRVRITVNLIENILNLRQVNNASAYSYYNYRIPFLSILNFFDNIKGLEEQAKEFDNISKRILRISRSEFPSRTSHGSSHDLTFYNVYDKVKKHFPTQQEDFSAVNDPEYLHHNLKPHQLEMINFLKHQEIKSSQQILWSDVTVNSSHENKRACPGEKLQYCEFLQQFRKVDRTYTFDVSEDNCTSGILTDDVGTGKTRAFTYFTFLDYIRRAADQKSPTIVICGTTMVGHWYKEAVATAETLGFAKERVHLYYGTGRKKDIDALNDAVLIITTINVIQADKRKQCQATSAGAGSSLNEDPTGNLRFLRLVVDESHKANSAVISWCANTKAQHRWCISATPCNNYSLFTNHLIMLHIKLDSRYLKCILNSSNSLNRICYFMKNFTRSTDHKLEITLQQRLLYITLPEKSRDIYESLKQDTINYIRNNRYNGVLSKRKFDILRKKLSCGNLERVNLSDIPNLHENADSLLNHFTERSPECPICLNPIETMTLTKCHHNFCLSCITKAIEAKQKCPMCRTVTDLSSIKLLEYPQIVDSQSTQFVKVDKLYEIVVRGAASDKNKKFVVFSEFNTTIQIIKDFFNSHSSSNSHVKLFEIKTNMTQKRRNEEIDGFSADKGISIFLLNYRCSSVGINLQCSSEIVFMEPILNTDTFHQCVGRIKRIGQKETKVVCTTLCAQDSLESILVEKVAATGSWVSSVGNMIRILE